MADNITTEYDLDDFDPSAEGPPLAPQVRWRTGELIATPSKVIFSAPLDSQERGIYIVATVKDQDGNEVRIAGNDHDEIVKLGTLLRFYGKVTNHVQYGEQFAFSAVVLHVPADRRGIVRYLTTTCEGIGTHRAELLWKAYGPDAVRVLRESPDRVAKDAVIGGDLADLCSMTLRTLARFEATTIELWSLFDGRGFPRSLVAACLNLWNVRAAAIVRRDPFRLMTARLPGCGFVRCDRLWLDLGKNPSALKRQVLAGVHAIGEDRTGNTWHASEDIEDGIRKRLGDVDGVRVNASRAILAGTRAPARYFSVHEDGHGGKWVTLARHAKNERVVAEAVRRLLVRGKGKLRRNGTTSVHQSGGQHHDGPSV